MTPRKAKTLDDICALPRDVVTSSEHWMMIKPDVVVVAAQRNSEESTAKIVF
jgi:hypothetical protein